MSRWQQPRFEDHSIVIKEATDTTMSLWREMSPGREEAIETLVDMDQGDFYRAARVLVSLCSIQSMRGHQPIRPELSQTFEIFLIVLCSMI